MEWCNLIRTCTTSHFKQEGPGDRSFCIGDAINQNIHRKPVSVSKCFCCNSSYVPVASTKPSRAKQERKTGKSCVLLSLQSTSKRARARKNKNKVLSEAVARVQLEQCCCLCVLFFFFLPTPLCTVSSDCFYSTRKAYLEAFPTVCTKSSAQWYAKQHSPAQSCHKHPSQTTARRVHEPWSVLLQAFGVFSLP